MSYFNEEQEGYMRYLASLPEDKKCDCKWYTKDECERMLERGHCPHQNIKQANPQ